MLKKYVKNIHEFVVSYHNSSVASTSTGVKIADCPVGLGFSHHDLPQSPDTLRFCLRQNHHNLALALIIPVYM